ncbi:MAG: hypothetical protein KDB90_00220 [Planctomycetes bacterium]|nr:hypothetical protein [Planctomycetota bacterium]
MRAISRLLLLALFLSSFVATAGCDGSSGGSGSGSSGREGGGGSAQTGNSATSSEVSLAQQVLVLVNQERANVGVGALTMHTGCAQVAYDHSWDMDFRDFFSHTNPDGATPFDRMHHAGVNYSAAGENIAAGYSTPAAAMAGWMNSAGHRANILNANFTEIGIGVREGNTGSYGIYWTQVFRRP